MPHSSVNWVVLLAEISHQHFQDIAHHVVEHEETGGFLNGCCWIPIGIEQVENRSQDFIHTLNIGDIGVQSCKDKQNSSHIVIIVSGFLLLA